MKKMRKVKKMMMIQMEVMMRMNREFKYTLKSSIMRELVRFQEVWIKGSVILQKCWKILPSLNTRKRKYSTILKC